jgi:methylated-DNA-[protein]-cysteine S-methyltransferase
MTEAQAFTLFETAIGWCGIGWGPRGIVAVQLPEESEAATRARLRRRIPDAPETDPPAQVQRAINQIVALLRGEPEDLSEITLDMEGIAAFNALVYVIARKIPTGETRTYGEIAREAGAPEKAREIGQALGRNPFPIIVPCHRVLGADGKAGGFSAPGGVDTKLRMLTIERARTSAAPQLFEALPLATRPRQA